MNISWILLISTFTILFSTCVALNVHTRPDIPLNKTILFEPDVMVLEYTCYADEMPPPELMMRWYYVIKHDMYWVPDIPDDYRNYELSLELDDSLHGAFLFCALIPRTQAYGDQNVQIVVQSYEVLLLSVTKLDVHWDSLESSEESKETADTVTDNLSNISGEGIGNSTSQQNYGEEKKEKNSDFPWAYLIGSNVACIFAVILIVGIAYCVHKKKASKSTQHLQNTVSICEPEYAYIPLNVVPLYDAKDLLAQNKKIGDVNKPPIPNRPFK